MGVRAKMYLETVAEKTWCTEVTLKVVTRQNPEGEAPGWSAATPTGELRLNIKNREAADRFMGRAGEEFYVDITPVVETEG